MRSQHTGMFVKTLLTQAMAWCAISAGATSPPPATYTFFDAGRPLCEIVLPSKPADEEKEAAELIQGIFRAMSGVQTPIIRAPSAESAVHIHVGLTPFTRTVLSTVAPPDLDLDGFVIHPVDAANLVLLGGRPTSTFYAVTELLERYAGVLWVWPGEHGTVVPKTDKLTVTVHSQFSAPVFPARQFSGLGQVNTKLWRIRSDQRDTRAYFSHNTAKILHPKLFAEHPEYFAMSNGNRHAVDKRWQACTSNPDVIRLFIEGALAQFRRPSREHVISFSVSPNDGGVEEFCQCPACRSLDAPGVEGVSDRYFTFVNAVADGVREEFPSKLIACMAYGVPTRNVPVKVKLRPNTLVYLVIPTLKDHHADVLEWSQAAPHLGAYFHLHGKAVPKFYPHAFARYLRFLRENRVQGVYAEVYPETAERMSSWALEGPRVWMLSKLVWDPAADADQLVDQFCARFYGPAAPAMLRFYRQCEAAWERRPDPYAFSKDHRDYELDLYTIEDMKILHAALAEALRIAAGDQQVRARLLAQQTALNRTAGYYAFLDLPSALTALRLDGEEGAAAIVASVNARANKAAATSPDAPFALMPKAAEAVIDARFGEITATLGKDAKRFWDQASQQYPLVTPFIQPQVLRSNGQISNIARNPGFETAGKKAQNSATADADWQATDAPGWSMWIRPNAPGRIVVDRQTARSGQASLLIHGCDGGSGIQNAAVHPGERYRVSVWARATAGGKDEQTAPGATLSIHWKSPDGKWHAKQHNASVELPRGTTQWQRLSLDVTVPPGAGHMVVLLGASSQGAAGKAWFDDFSIERLYADQTR